MGGNNRGGRGWGQNRGRGGSRGSFRGRGNRDNYRGGRGGGFRGRNQNYGRQQNQNYGQQQNQNYGNDQKWQRGPKREKPGKRLSELEIGVTEYVSDHDGFLGIIKSRYSDFQVSEINERGEVAKLTTLEPPTPAGSEEVEQDEELLLNKYNTEILPMETWDRINSLLRDPAAQKVEVDVTGMTKEQRTKIHEAVKRAFGTRIVASTVAVDDKKVLHFDRYRKGVRVDKRVKWVWGGEYVRFILYKENTDTMEAARALCERLRLNIRPSMLGYSGTKDRRAKTSQWFSLRKVDPRKIAMAAKGIREFQVGNYSFSDTHLKLGMLQGNQFRIALRNVTVADSTVDEACSRLRERGFINYYGLQRFGTRVDMPTHRIGRYFLQRNFKDAIDGILFSSEGPLWHALHVFATEGAVAALHVWPRGVGSVERQIVEALAVSPNDLIGAVNKLPRNTRLLYIHSYQSLVWNHAASERLRRHGLVPAVGDMAAVDQVTEDILPEIIEDNEPEDTDAEDAQDGGDDKMADNPTDDSAQNIQQSSKKQAKVLTEEDIQSGKYTIFDIVLPLPGYMIDYPPNMKDYYDKILAEDGVKMEFDKRFRSFSMSGAYRHLVSRPDNMSWRLVRYSDPYADLVASDRDELEGRQLDGIVEDGKYKALLLTMSLPASCYATMALRELLKVDTACDNQALQNNYHKKDDLKTIGQEIDGEQKDDSKEDETEKKENESREDKIENESREEETEKTEGEGDKGDEMTCESNELEVDSQSSEKRKADSSSDDGVDAKKSKQE